MLDVVGTLRGEGGCPWDREQTLASLKPFLVEETYELIDAVDSDDPARHREELGDVLLQLVLHCQIRKEQGDFTFGDVAATLCEKLVRRHPHVFGDVLVSGSSEVLSNWEVIKSSEKEGGPRSALEGVPNHLPALHKAQRVQARAARVGFDWSETVDVVAKVDEELAEVKQAVAADDRETEVREEIGDLLFSVVNLCRFLHIDAEEALRATISKFVRRFREVEQRLRALGKAPGDCSLAEMDAVWDAVKAEEQDA